MKKPSTTTNKKISITQVILTVLSVVALLIGNILAGKQWNFLFGITMTGAIIIFPITYILSDVFSEVYGYKWSRFTCYLGFAMNILMVLAFQIAIILPASPFYQGQEAFASVLGNTPRILFASLLAYIVGDFINDKIFQKMKEKSQKGKGFSLRAIISSIAGELTDSLIFIPLAFFGTLPFGAMIIMGLTQVSLKVLYEVLILPISSRAVKKLSKIEEIE